MGTIQSRWSCLPPQSLPSTAPIQIFPSHRATLSVDPLAVLVVVTTGPQDLRPLKSSGLSREGSCQNLTDSPHRFRAYVAVIISRTRHLDSASV